MGTNDDNHNNGGDFVSNLEESIVKKQMQERDEMREAAGIIGDTSKGGMGVLKSLSVAPDEVRNILLTANFMSYEEAEKVAAAICEARRYGCSLDPILDWVVAHCAISTEQRSRVEWLVRSMTRYELDGPNTSQGRSHWWQGKGQNGQDNSGRVTH